MATEKKQKRIMFSGGGTGGSVTPLLAVAARLFEDDGDIDISFVGSRQGVERSLVEDFRGPRGERLRFLSLPSGKWRRYLSWRNIVDIFNIILAFFCALGLLRRERPRLVVSAGSFVSVPLAWAAAVMKIPVLVHQQDIRPGLANKLMAPFARAITVVFEKSLADYGPRAIITGNPHPDIRPYLAAREETRKRYGLDKRPLVLVFGGGTGALAINELFAAAWPELAAHCQAIHLSGANRPATSFSVPGCQSFPFLPIEELLSLMATADLVISRAGLGALTDLSALRRPAIIIPMPHSHQEDNAAVFAAKDAAMVLDQEKLTASELATVVKELLADSERRERLSDNIGRALKPEATAALAGIIWEIIGD